MKTKSQRVREDRMMNGDIYHREWRFIKVFTCNTLANIQVSPREAPPDVIISPSPRPGPNCQTQPSKLVAEKDN